MDASKTLDAIKARAKEGRFISYGDLAEANEIPRKFARLFVKVRHLSDVSALAGEKQLPIVTAVVVKAGNCKDGLLPEKNRQAVAKAAELQGRKIPDISMASIKKLQDEVFRWAKGLAE